MIEVVDTHCHLDFEDFSNDLDKVIIRANKKGVKYFLTISINLEDFNKVLNVANKNKHIWCTTGIHPNNVKNDLQSSDLEKIFEELKKNVKSNNKKVIGLGETGLDFYRNNENKINQLKSFDLHLELSGINQCPVIVHTRDAENETIEMLNEKVKKYNSKGLIHCFTSSKKLAKIALDNNFYISIAGIVTFKNSHDLKKIINYIPNDRLLIETDSPYLAPVPERGKRNEPSFIINTLNTISELKNMDVYELSLLTTNNFFNLFSNIDYEN